MKFKRLYLDSPTIQPKHEHDAGFDIPAYEDCILEAHSSLSIATGIAVEIPEGWVGLLVGRSGLRFKHHVHADDVGIIDSAYRGELKVLLENSSGFPLFIQQGDRIAQLVLVPSYTEEVEEVQELSSTSRGTHGFGSTGGIQGIFMLD